MTSDRLKSLVKLRLVLSVIALLLAGTMVFSGVMHLVTGGKAPVEELDQPASQETAATEPEEQVTVATEAATEEQVEETESQEKLGTQEAGPKDAQSGQSGESDSPGNQGNTAVTEPSVETVVPENTKPFNPPPENPNPENPAPENPAPENPNPENPNPENQPDVPDDDKHANSGKDGKSLSAEQQTLQKSLSDSGETRSKSFPWGILFWGSAGLLAADLMAILILSDRIKKEKEALRKAGAKAPAAPAPGVSAAPIPRTQRIRTVAARPAAPAVPTVGTIHQIGARDYQQDSLGHTQVLGEKGVLAVVADGMGGLSGGEKVSQRIVVNAMNMGSQLKAGQTNGVLWKMVNQINEDVNRLLGPEGLYKSGSTLVAVLACGGQFQWIAVGDSRIYLYRQGYANQLNQDHDQLQAWMADVLEGRRSLEEVLRHPDGRKLTSFIGMGQLKHIDGSLSPIALEAGDRLVLMTDGVYSVVNEERLAAVLKRFPDVNQAASAMDRMIREAKNPHQDNYTAIILGF